MRNPGLAAVPSPIIPGVGGLRNGRILAGISCLVTPELRMGSGGLLRRICHAVAAYTGYSYVRDHRVRR